MLTFLQKQTVDELLEKGFELVDEEEANNECLMVKMGVMVEIKDDGEYIELGRKRH